MISFIYRGSEKRVYRFLGGRRWLAILVDSNSLIKNLAPFEDDAEIRLLKFLM